MLEHNGMKTYEGVKYSYVYAYLTLALSFLLKPFYSQGKSPQDLSRRLKGPQSWSGHCEGESDLLLLPEI
jgi:hypothetical protein